MRIRLGSCTNGHFLPRGHSPLVMNTRQITTPASIVPPFTPLLACFTPILAAAAAPFASATWQFAAAAAPSRPASAAAAPELLPPDTLRPDPSSAALFAASSPTQTLSILDFHLRCRSCFLTTFGAALPDPTCLGLRVRLGCFSGDSTLAPVFSFA
eukprot:scaffold2393_cov267-Pinguiococcus_pyrenoidosus.AAC.22